jgi:4-hydroxybenzoyl-CoA reductase subunit beta
MSLPEFELVRPVSLDAALETLARYGANAQIVAGGTDLIPSMKQRLFGPRVVLDIKGLSDLDYIRFDPQQGLEIGALTTIAAIAESALIAREFQVLHEAAKSIASPLLRNMGTLGGNLCLDTRCLYYNQSSFWRESLGYCLKKEGNVCHVAPGGHFCWAVFSGDCAPALLALGASVLLAGPRGKREVAMVDFYINDGMAWIRKERDEIVTGVRVPASRGWKGTYKKLRIRQSIDYPLAGVAAVMKTDGGGICTEARVALTGVNPAPQLVAAAEQMVGKSYDATLVDEVAHEAIRTGKPLTTSSSTPEYRRNMIRVFVRRALQELWLNGNNADRRFGN